VLWKETRRKRKRINMSPKKETKISVTISGGKSRPRDGASVGNANDLPRSCESSKHGAC
jgi:hypothetical protein